jgi:hypothetical protein
MLENATHYDQVQLLGQTDLFVHSNKIWIMNTIVSVEMSGEGSRLSGHHAFLTDRDIYLHQAQHGWEDHKCRYRSQSECMLEHVVEVG